MTSSFGFAAAVFMASSVKKRVLPHPQGPNRMSFFKPKIALCLGVRCAQALMFSKDPACPSFLLTTFTMLLVNASGIAGAEKSAYCKNVLKSSGCLTRLGQVSSPVKLKIEICYLRYPYRTRIEGTHTITIWLANIMYLFVLNVFK